MIQRIGGKKMAASSWDWVNLFMMATILESGYLLLSSDTSE